MCDGFGMNIPHHSIQNISIDILKNVPAVNKPSPSPGLGNRGNEKSSNFLQRT